MASSYCSITLIGYVAREPETRYLAGGDPVTDFSIPVSERRKDGQEITTWFRITAFGRLADICGQYLHKGSYAYVEGTLTQRDWTDRDGNRRTTLEVRAREMRMLDRRAESAELDAGLPGGTPSGAPIPAGDDVNMDDVPF